MNRIAELLFIIGWLTIVSGVVVGIANYETVVGYESSEFSIYEEEPITETSWVNAAIYILAGLIWGIMIFGFAEIIRIMDDKRNLAKQSLQELVSLNKTLNATVMDDEITNNKVSNNPTYQKEKQSKNELIKGEKATIDYSPLLKKESPNKVKRFKDIIEESVNGTKN